MDPRSEYVTFEVLPEGFPGRERMLALGRLRVVLRRAAFAGFLPRPDVELCTEDWVEPAGKPVGPVPTLHLADFLQALLPAREFSFPGTYEQRLALRLALDDLVDDRADRWFNPAHRWPKDMLAYLRRHYRTRHRETLARNESGLTRSPSSDPDRGVRPEGQEWQNPERTAALLRANPKWAQLISGLSQAQRAAVEKALGAYALGYIWHSRRGRALADHLTPAELRAWRRACQCVPRLREVVASLWGDRKKTWGRLRGQERIYRRLMKEAPSHRLGLSEMLAFSPGAVEEKPAHFAFETDLARAGVLRRIGSRTEDQFRQHVGLPDTVAGREVLCLFYLDELVFTRLFDRLPSPAAYQHVADSARRKAPPKAKSTRTRAPRTPKP